jgi:hypothetical protein
MTYRIPLLLALLGIQVLLILLVTLAASGDQEPQPFLSIDPEAVTRVTVGGAGDAAVELIREESDWALGNGLPADADKVMNVIRKLGEGSATWPVATSAESRERFEVTAEKHQRRVSFFAGDELLAEIYVGTSPGFRRVHVRADDADAVYSIDFAVHELPTDSSEWLDRSLFRSEDVSRVTLPGGAVLSRASGEDAWLLDGVPADAEAAEELVERIERLSVLGLYDGPEEALDAPRGLDVVSGSGEYRLEFRHDADDDEYVLTSDRYAGRFTVPAYAAEQILIEPDELMTDPEAAASPEGAEQAVDPSAEPDAAGN